MKEYMMNQPIDTFAIPEGIVFARMNSYTGAISKSDEPGGTYAAFAGSLPTGRSGPESELSEDLVTGTGSYTSSSESFFKSDLF